MPFSSLRPKNSEAQRCGQRWSITPTRPELSRNAISCSPSNKSRIGAPSCSNSLDRAGHRDPVADLRAAGIEFFARQSLNGGSILALQHIEKTAVERLVDDEMRQPAGADDADPRVARMAFDRRPDRLSQAIAAPR